MDNDQIHIKLEGVQSSLEILHGKAPDPIKPKAILVNGTIDAPLLFLEKRLPDLKNAHILVDREAMSILLITEENVEYFNQIKGSLKMTDEFKSWLINEGSTWNHRELALFIKLHRANFENRDMAIKLSDQLQNLKVKAEKILEDEADKKGNRKILIQQIIKEMNLPESFTILLPIFKGGKKVKLEVEIYINADDYSCALVSPDAAESVRTTRDDTIDEVLTKIKDIKPELVIMEV